MKTVTGEETVSGLSHHDWSIYRLSWQANRSGTHF